MDKILERISKLLQVNVENGATEGEAANAAVFVQQLLQEHNLTLAQVEQSGGSTDAAPREKKETGKRAMYKYQRDLMAVIAGSNFCMHQIVTVREDRRNKNLPQRKSQQHCLVGRTINVQASVMLYDYLQEAVQRACIGAGFTTGRDGHFFMEGAVSRLRNRLYEKQRQAERESAEKAAAATARGNGTGRELVLADVYGTESDQNNDFLNNFPIGTTATRRREAIEKNAKREAEEKRLIDEGVDATEAFYRSHGYGIEQAKTYAEDWKKQSARTARGGRGRSQNWTRHDEKHHVKVNSPAYQAGRIAGNHIGLDPQVAAATRKRLTRG